MSVVVFIGSKTRGTSPRKSRITPTDLRQIFAYYVIESIQDLNFILCWQTQCYENQDFLVFLIPQKLVVMQPFEIKI